MKIDYKFSEDKTLKELEKYIDSTYDMHYSKSKFQATEFIIDVVTVKDFVSVIY